MILSGLDTLTRIQTWLIDALTAEGMRRTTASALSHSDTPEAAHQCGERHILLEAMPDRREWEQDARQCATLLRHLCGEPTDDTSTRWRAALVDWRPEEIADILTDLTGHPVTSGRLRKARADGRLTPIAGRIILGQAASAIGL